MLSQPHESRVGLGGCIHALRHTTATRLCRAGTPMNVVKAIMGWKSTAMVMRYAHECPEGKREAMRGMEQRFNNPALKIG